MRWEIQCKPRQKVAHHMGWKVSQQTSPVDGVHLELVHVNAWRVPVMEKRKARDVGLVVEDALRKSS